MRLPTFPGGFIASLSIPGGASARATTTWGAIISSGPAISAKPGVRCSRAARIARSAKSFVICGRPRRETDRGGKTIGWTAPPIGAACSSTRCAFPILLLDMARREGGALLAAGPPTVLADGRARRAPSSCATGPRTKQDRWEENAGYTPFTLAVTIAALLAAAEIAEASGHRGPASSAARHGRRLERADRGLDLCRGHATCARSRRPRLLHTGCSRIVCDGRGPDAHGLVQVRNHEVGSGSILADELISTDAIALVRFGLRAPEDPRVLGTIAVIDRLLKVELPQGLGRWRRYNLDGYGEKADGSPFDGVGIGRVWPLLAGERAHYALAAGKREEVGRRCSRQSRRRPVLAASFPSRCGTPHPFPIGSLRPASRRVRQCPSSGRTGNM